MWFKSSCPLWRIWKCSYSQSRGCLHGCTHGKVLQATQRAFVHLTGCMFIPIDWPYWFTLPRKWQSTEPFLSPSPHFQAEEAWRWRKGEWIENNNLYILPTGLFLNIHVARVTCTIQTFNLSNTLRYTWWEGTPCWWLANTRHHVL